MKRIVGDPFSPDPAERRRLARLLSAQLSPPRGLDAECAALRPADRITRAYPLGAARGALMALHLAASAGRRLPRGIADPTGPPARAWAEGLAAGLVRPPKAVFRAPRATAGGAIYRAGAEAGMLCAIDRMIGER